MLIHAIPRHNHDSDHDRMGAVMASIVKRGGKWKVEVWHKGTRKSKSFSTKAEARAWALETEVAIDQAQGGSLLRVMARLFVI